MGFYVVTARKLGSDPPPQKKEENQKLLWLKYFKR